MGAWPPPHSFYRTIIQYNLNPLFHFAFTTKSLRASGRLPTERVTKVPSIKPEFELGACGWEAYPFSAMTALGIVLT